MKYKQIKDNPIKIFIGLKSINTAQKAIEKAKIKYLKSLVMFLWFVLKESFFFFKTRYKNITPRINNAKVDNMKGEPKIAPIAISCPVVKSFEIKNEPIIATIGTMTSGKPVPKTARIEPVAFLFKLSLIPKLSIAFVNKIQAKTIAKSEDRAIVKCVKKYICFSFGFWYPIRNGKRNFKND